MPVLKITNKNIHNYLGWW